jgi:hypothetical protein
MYTFHSCLEALIYNIYIYIYIYIHIHRYDLAILVYKHSIISENTSIWAHLSMEIYDFIT